MLNLLTPATVAAAAGEIRSGVRISLDWPLDKPRRPSYGRTALQHNIMNRRKNDSDEDRPVNDDTVCFNTQTGSQWDGFRHYGYLREKRYFNGCTPEDIRTSTVIGIDAWAASGGIVGRGVLLDYASYAERHSITLQPFTTTPVALSHLKAIVDEQGLEIRPGDILFVRTGFTAAFDALTTAEQDALPERLVAAFAGIETSMATLEWFWTCRFAAVAADCPAFESSPVGTLTDDPTVTLHQWLLAGWGMPIGEMFDLERLAEHCASIKRWSFFLSSVPLKVPGGVASPPNAVAIF